MSKKAQETKLWLEQSRPDIEYACPDLSSYPERALAKLDEVIGASHPESNFLIGSSLGGFWASYFVERGLAKKAVLINPAVSPHTRFAQLVGQELKHYYNDEVCCLTNNDLEVLESCEAQVVQSCERLWLMLQTGDEVLDYRLAERRYKKCKQTIEQGGNHSFENYAAWLPEIIDFFEQ